MELAVAFMLGLLGSLHCAAMCGPLMLALPAPPGGPLRFCAGRILYQLGRITTYGLLGAAGGGVGKTLFAAGLQRSLSITLGLAVLGGFLISRKVALSAPVQRLVGHLKLAMSAQWQRRSFRSLVLLGLLNGLLPCGLVYVALAGAVSHGTPQGGMGYMAAFGFGTMPATLGISLLGKTLPFRMKWRRAIPVGVFLLSGLLILRGLSLGIPYVSPDLSSGTPGCCAH